MSHLEGTFPVTRRLDLFYQAWLPDSRPPRAALVLVHGLADHSSRYGNLINYLLPRGFAVWSYDQRGHGCSPGKRVFVNRFDDLEADLAKFVEFVKTNNPGLALFVIGHSMGALETTLLAAGQIQGVNGIILSGVILKAGDSIPKIAVLLSRLLSAVAPGLGVQKLNCAGISRDSSVVDGYVNDPLVYTGKVPARMGAELLKAMAVAQSRLNDITLPVLLLHGKADRLADPSGSQMMYDGIRSADKELHIFNGCYHEIFNEPCHDFVLGTLTRWLDKRLKA